MIKRIMALCTAMMMCTALLAGCGNSDNSTADSTTAAESVADKVPETDEEWHQAMIDKSMYSYGNTTAMHEKIKKAQAGEEVTVAYLGGSITEGISAGAEDCYAKLTYQHFADTFGTGDNVKYCNAGLSGTPSTLGVLRLDRDVLSSNPDIVFVEYAVNDGSESDYQNAYESILRTLIEKDIAVVLLFSVTEEGHSAQDYMKELGTYYDLPMISYCDALRYMFDNNKMTWQDFSDDQSHPNVEGHKLVAEMVDNYFDTVMEQEEAAYTYPTEPMTSIMPYGAHLYENTTLEAESLGSWRAKSTITSFENGWRYAENGENEPVVFKFKAKMIYLIYKEVLTGNFGTAHFKISADGEVVKEIDVNAINSSGWGNAEVQNLVMSDTEKDYEIEVTMIDGDEEKSFQILGFGYTD